MTGPSQPRWPSDRAKGRSASRQYVSRNSSIPLSRYNDPRSPLHPVSPCYHGHHPRIPRSIGGAPPSQDPVQEAKTAEAKLTEARDAYDEFLILRFKARNVKPFQFKWLNQQGTELDYGAILTRASRKYDNRF